MSEYYQNGNFRQEAPYYFGEFTEMVNAGLIRNVKSVATTRREKFRIVVTENFGGDRKKVAELLGFSDPSLISRYLTLKGKSKKNIGNKLARKIERISRRAEFWLDTPLAQNTDAPLLGVNEAPAQYKPLRAEDGLIFDRDAVAALPPVAKAQIEGFIAGTIIRATTATYGKTAPERAKRAWRGAAQGGPTDEKAAGRRRKKK
jgi:hypothetical protein